MPIYAYRCAACGHAQDVLQKMSDPVLVVCPACDAPAYVKQVTAAGFQLKGSGWYVTDFRGDKKTGKAADGAEDKTESKGDQADSGDAKAAPAEAAGDGGADKKGDKKADAATSPAASTAATPAASPVPAPAASPAPTAASGKTGT